MFKKKTFGLFNKKTRRIIYVYTMAIHMAIHRLQSVFLKIPTWTPSRCILLTEYFFSAEWDCCVQVALYLVSALHKLQLVLISEKQHFREENDLRKWCFMFCFLFGVMLILANAFHPWALSNDATVFVLETCYILGIWELGVFRSKSRWLVEMQMG